MKQYKVISVKKHDKEYGLEVGDIVTETKIKDGNVLLFKLPKHLYGRGHKGVDYSLKFKGYKKDNYKWLDTNQVKEIVE